MKRRTSRRFSLEGMSLYLALQAPLKAPPHSTPVAIQLMPRLITIRRKKMKKHKRRKRYDRDFFKYQKYHREKKLRVGLFDTRRHDWSNVSGRARIPAANEGTPGRTRCVQSTEIRRQHNQHVSYFSYSWKMPSFLAPWRESLQPR